MLSIVQSLVITVAVPVLVFGVTESIGVLDSLRIHNGLTLACRAYLCIHF